MDDTVVSQQADVAQQQQAPISHEQQKMVPQDDVNRIVAREKAAALEKGRREAELAYQQKLEAINTQRNAGASREVDADALYQQVKSKLEADREAEKAEREHELRYQQANHIASKYAEKINLARSKYDDFDQTISTFDPGVYTNVACLLADMPNGGDVLYELQKNPEKLANVDYLSNRNPEHAKVVLNKLAMSIQQNQEAMSNSPYDSISKPLDRLSNSRVAGDNGKKTLSDLRKMPWARG